MLSIKLVKNLIKEAYQKGWERLDLSHKELYDLPESIGKCTNLKLLDLSCNKFDKIPESISQLTDLEELYINDNHIKIVADDIENLSKLQVLDLRNNNLDNVSESIGKLINLRMLGLNSKNIISGISKSRWIQNLQNLETLVISQINLNEKAQLFLSFPKLKYIIIDNGDIYDKGDQVNRPPSAILEEGFDSTLEYFQQIETDGIDYLYEAKLIIVGEAGAGKTTLANKIIDNNYQLCEEDSTMGIEVTKWEYQFDEKNYTVNIWDFGGHEIYHSTHQYFLTKSSLYVIVADNRREDNDFDYWLNIVELLSDNSPIVIMQNERQNRSKRDINIKQLRGEFESLKDNLGMDLSGYKGLDDICYTFKRHLSSLPHMGSAIPKSWVKVRASLESDQRNQITLKEYLKICIDSGLGQFENALELSEYLHKIGICLHFQNDINSPLYKIVILKPKWATDAAYAVLDNQKVIKNNGRFSDEDLAQIWISEDYAGMYGELLGLMKKFQLCGTGSAQ